MECVPEVPITRKVRFFACNEYQRSIQLSGMYHNAALATISCISDTSFLF